MFLDVNHVDEVNPAQILGQGSLSPLNRRNAFRWQKESTATNSGVIGMAL